MFDIFSTCCLHVSTPIFFKLKVDFLGIVCKLSLCCLSPHPNNNKLNKHTHTTLLNKLGNKNISMRNEKFWDMPGKLKWEEINLRNGALTYFPIGKYWWKTGNSSKRALFIYLFFKHLYWSIIALQWCVSFCFITKWISYTYTYVPISLPSCISLPPTLPIPPL